MIIKNEYGFYELKDKPPSKKLEEYYAKKYYQEGKGSYERAYTKEEIKCFHNKIEERFYLINKYLNKTTNKNILDIGCGEGWALSFFKNKGWQVKGIDYSDHGCEKFNADCLENLLVGDIQDLLKELIKNGEKYDVIWLDNVLEHVLDPKVLLESIKNLLRGSGLLLVEVPNDFSELQHYLIENNYVNEKFWIVEPDHISYFNKDGLKNLLNKVGFESLISIGDYPIDLNLLNTDSNYIKDKSKGKNCHMERVAFENFLHRQPINLVIEFYQAMMNLGIGRQITGLFKLRKN